MQTQPTPNYEILFSIMLYATAFITAFKATYELTTRFLNYLGKENILPQPSEQIRTPTIMIEPPQAQSKMQTPPRILAGPIHLDSKKRRKRLPRALSARQKHYARMLEEKALAEVSDAVPQGLPSIPLNLKLPGIDGPELSDFLKNINRLMASVDPSKTVSDVAYESMFGKNSQGTNLVEAMKSSFSDSMYKAYVTIMDSIKQAVSDLLCKMKLTKPEQQEAFLKIFAVAILIMLIRKHGKTKQLLIFAGLFIGTVALAYRLEYLNEIYDYFNKIPDIEAQSGEDVGQSLTDFAVYALMIKVMDFSDCTKFIKSIKGFSLWKNDIKAVMETVLQLLQRGLDYFCTHVLKTSSFPLIASHLPEVNKWLKRVRALLVTSLDVPNHKAAALQSEISQAEFDYQKILNSIKDRDVRNRVLDSARPTYQQLLRARERLQLRGHYPTGSRQMTLFMMLRGESGVGKSKVLFPFLFEFCAAVMSPEELERYGEDMSSAVYARNFDDPWWDAYHGQFATIIDEYGMTHKSKEEKTNVVSDAIRNVNTISNQVPAAAADLKNLIYFTSKVQIATSNLDDIIHHATGLIAYPKALARRVHFDVVVSVKQEYCTDETFDLDFTLRELDVAKVQAKYDMDFTKDIYEFYVYNRKDDYHEVMYYDELMEAMIAKYRHFEREHQSVASNLNDCMTHGLKRRKDNYVPTFNTTPEMPEKIILEPSAREKIDNFFGKTREKVKETQTYKKIFELWNSSNKEYKFEDFGYDVDFEKIFTEDVRAQSGDQIERLSAFDTVVNYFHLSQLSFRSFLKNFWCFYVFENPTPEDLPWHLRYIRKVKEYFNGGPEFYDASDDLDPMFEKRQKQKDFDDYVDLFDTTLDRAIVVICEWSALIFSEYPKLSMLCIMLYVAFACMVYTVIIGLLSYAVGWLFNLVVTTIMPSYGQPPDPKSNATAKQEVNDEALHVALAKQGLNRNTSFDPLDIVAQGYIPQEDRAAEDIMAKVYTKNLYAYTRDGVHKGYIIFVDGTRAICPAHFIAEIRSNPNSKYTLRDMSNVHTSVTSTMLLARVDCDHSNDFAFIDVPCMRMHSDIRKLFVQSDNFTQRTNGNCLLIRSQKGLPVIRTFKFNLNYNTLRYQYQGVDFGLRNAVIYDAQTFPGDCGLPLVLVDPASRSAKIIGFHTSFSSAMGTAFASIVPQELLLESKPFIEPQVNCSLQHTAIIGKLQRPVSMFRSSEIRRSPMYGKVSRSQKAPALLRPERDSEGNLHDPWEIALKRYDCDKPVFPKGELEHITDVVMNHLFTAVDPYNENLSVLSIEEVFTGIPHEPYVDGLNLNTSPGYPWNLTIVPNLPGKRRFVGPDPNALDFDNPHFKKLVININEIAEKAINSEDPTLYWIFSLKDELQSRKKRGERKTRAFQTPPVEYTVLFCQHYKRLIALMMRKRWKTGMLVGIDCYSREWCHLANLVQDYPTGGTNIPGDWSQFDTIQLEAILRLIGIGYENFFKDKTHRKLREFLWNVLVRAFIIYGDLILQWLGNLPSGHPMTTIINCTYNLVLLYFGFWKITKMYPTPFISNSFNVRFLVYGDDNIIHLNPLLKHLFDGVKFSQLYASYNIKYTGADKELCKEFSSLSETTFLKRRFLYDEEFKHWFCPLELETILEMVMWTKKGPYHDSIPIEKVATALTELALHEEEVFNYWAPLIIEASKEYLNYSPAITNQRRLRAIVLNII